MAEERRLRWNSWPLIIIRVIAYLIILGMLWYWKSAGRTAGETRPQPEKAGPVDKSDSSGETVIETTIYFPQVTLYGWAVRPTPEGGQQVDVLLKFEANADEVEFKELKLRVKGSQEDLAMASAPQDQEKVRKGLVRLQFVLPAGAPEFRAGRVFLWVKDLCVLDRNQRVTPQNLDQWAEEIKSAPEPDPEEKPESQPSALLPVQTGATVGRCSLM